MQVHVVEALEKSIDDGLRTKAIYELAMSFQIFNSARASEKDSHVYGWVTRIEDRCNLRWPEPSLPME